MSSRALLCALLLLTVVSLLPGCNRTPEKSVEELETEEVRNERRSNHMKLAPKQP